MFDILVSDITRIVKAKEKRGKRNDQSYQDLTNAVRYLLKILWEDSTSTPVRRSGFHFHKTYYSSTNRYTNHLGVAYRQVKQAYDTLIKLGLIIETDEHRHDLIHPENNKLRLHIAAGELEQRLKGLDSIPALYEPPNLDEESIVLRLNKKLQPYDDDADTNLMRDNLKRINKCLCRHWLDLNLPDANYPELQRRLGEYDTPRNINLARRTLARVFSDGEFNSYGRFFRGWWQELPNDETKGLAYRQFLTIDGKKTVEYDFSSIAPNMIYLMNGKVLGEDAYNRVYNGDHRDIVKTALSAMLMAKTELKNAPEDLQGDLKDADLSWKDLKARILKCHKVIEDQFFQGKGKYLQFEDSKIAERVLLAFAKNNIPIYPVHDSFIGHHGYGSTGELEEEMRKAFHESFKTDIPIKEDVILLIGKEKTEAEQKQDFELRTIDMSLEAIWKDAEDYSYYTAREQMWWANRSKHIKKVDQY